MDLELNFFDRSNQMLGQQATGLRIRSAALEDDLVGSGVTLGDKLFSLQKRENCWQTNGDFGSMCGLGYR